MRSNPAKTPVRNRRFAQLLCGAAILAACSPFLVQAQPADAKPPEPKPVYETIYLSNLTQQSDLNDIQTAMRNVLPRAHIYGSQSGRSISLLATPDDIALAKRIVADLDRPRKLYRLTYGITEVVDGKRMATRHFALAAVSGEKAEMRAGTRVPLVTGSYDTGTANSNSQVQYVDVGLSIEATADPFQEGLRLRTKIEQSGVSEEKSGLGAPDPIFQQTRLEQTVTLVPGKPQLLGSLDTAAEKPGDAAGNSRHLEVEVVAELVK